MKSRAFLLLIFILLLSATWARAQDETTTFYHGVDLSYVNEMEDCGAVYHVNGEAQDPYQIFADHGANLVRIRLWHTPTWTEYSTYDDVVRSLQRANDLGMNVLLDFHYSDTWADPSKQIIPAAWADITDVDELGEALYQYTYDTLMSLDALGLMPEIVQVGNEINSEILRAEDAAGYPIDWDRNGALLNDALRAVRDADAASSESPRAMLHVAQPENVEGWMLAAEQAGVTDFDIIGMSYYSKWSRHSMETAGEIINQLRYRFGKEVMIVETGYPWTFDAVNETAVNIVDREYLEEGYPATPEGQRQYLIDLAQTVFNNGGLGIIYWEPAWVSTECDILWGQGSAWENATFFDFHNDNELLPAIDFLSYDYTYPVDVTLRFTFESADDLPEEIYFWGDFTGMGRRLLTLTLSDGAYELRTRLLPDSEIHYQFYISRPANADTALVPAECGDDEGHVTLVVPSSSVVIAATDAGCPAAAS